MKIFFQVFFAIVAGGIVLYFINISTIDIQLKVADEAAQKFLQDKKKDQLEEQKKQEELDKKLEKDYANWRALASCDRKAKAELGSSIKPENVVRNTANFVAFNLADNSGNLVHYRCIIDGDFKVTSFEKVAK